MILVTAVVTVCFRAQLMGDVLGRTDASSCRNLMEIFIDSDRIDVVLEIADSPPQLLPLATIG